MNNNDYKNEILKLKKQVERLKKSVKKQKYGLVWMDVPEAFEDDVENKLPILKEVPELAIKNDDGKPTHILIEGDNYHALTCLNYTHKGKVDVIYIDPPYNTGSDGFRYKDKRVLDKYPDGTEVPKDHPLRHSYWLSFMAKRLELAKGLLKKDGLIAISIDDNEFAQLKFLCDDILGENNRLSTHHIKVRYDNKSLNEDNDWQPVMEYLLIYARDKSVFKANKPSEDYNLEKFKYKINELNKGHEVHIGGKKVTIFKDGEWEILEESEGKVGLLKETWASGSLVRQSGTAAEFLAKYLIKRKDEDGLNVLYKIDNMGEDGLGYRYVTGPRKANAIRGKYYSGVPLERLSELENEGGSLKYRPISNFYDFSGDFGNIRHEGGVSFNSGKKPIKMLKEIINYHPNTQATVLDFFAGSGSTGHAVVDLNDDDKGFRKFILITNNEGGIMRDICYPRIKNVVNNNSIKFYSTAFVGNRSILKIKDEDKVELAHNAGELLALSENTLDLINKDDWIQLYENIDRYTAIYFREEMTNFEKFKSTVKKLDKPVSIYVFSWGDNEFPDDFAEIKDAKVKTIPAPILEIYKQIYNLNTK